MSELPVALAAAIERRLEGAATGETRDAAARLSAAYRAGATTRGALGGSGAGEESLLAYLATRMPATFAACAAVLDEAGASLPGFAPTSLLDVGAGPGTAAWAACARWPSIAKVSLMDAEPSLLHAGIALMREAPHPPLEAAEVLIRDARTGALPSAALVTASYLLVEMDDKDAARLAVRLFEHTTLALALIEPGTPAGFARIAAARAALVAAGATIAAPCPNDLPCPMAGGDWCHFAVRLPRRRAHKALKGAEVPYEDERFSYLIAARAGEVARAGARILARPERTKAGLAFKLCGGGTAGTRLIERRDKARFAAARRLSWGDRFEARLRHDEA